MKEFKGRIFLDILLMGLVFLCISHFYKIEVNSEAFKKIVYLILFLYGCIRIALYILWSKDTDYYSRPGVLPVLGEGFTPDYESANHTNHTHPKVNAFLQFMPLFFLAFVINKTVFELYRRARDWANNFLTIKLK